MRRLITIVVTAALTTVGSLYWLHDGDLDEAAELYTPDWNAEVLAKNAGIEEAP